MVYSKKTWVSNEVITKDALNNIETGIVDGRNLSEIIVDADKDMGGRALTNISNVGVTGNVTVSGTMNAKQITSDFKKLIEHENGSLVYENTGSWSVHLTTPAYISPQPNTVPTNVVPGSSVYVVAHGVAAYDTSYGGSVAFSVTHKRGGATIQVYSAVWNNSVGEDSDKSVVIPDIQGGDVLALTFTSVSAFGTLSNIRIKAVEIPISGASLW